MFKRRKPQRPRLWINRPILERAEATQPPLFCFPAYAPQGVGASAIRENCEKRTKPLAPPYAQPPTPTQPPHRRGPFCPGVANRGSPLRLRGETADQAFSPILSSSSMDFLTGSDLPAS